MSAAVSPDLAVVIKDFDESQHPRDWTGKFTSGGDTGESSGAGLKSVSSRAWAGKAQTIKTSLSKLEVGALGERTTEAYLWSLGHVPVKPTNAKINNFPVDLLADHMAVEVKTGLVSNGPSAQQWRATIGQPGKKEAK